MVDRTIDVSTVELDSLIEIHSVMAGLYCTTFLQVHDAIYLHDSEFETKLETGSNYTLQTKWLLQICNWCAGYCARSLYFCRMKPKWDSQKLKLDVFRTSSSVTRNGEAI